MEYERELMRRHLVLPEPKLGSEDTALLVVDMQYGDAHRDYGPIKRLRESGNGQAAEYYAQRLDELVIPKIRRLQDAFRAAGIEVVHTKIQSLTQDGRDRSLEHKSLGLHFPPGSKEAEILEELAPQGDEIVVTKTCSGVFNGTNMEYVLRNLGVKNLVVVGVITSACVETAVRDAADRSFSVVLVEDATAAWTPEMQEAAVRMLRGVYAVVKTTDEVVSLVGSSVRDQVLTSS